MSKSIVLACVLGALSLGPKAFAANVTLVHGIFGADLGLPQDLPVDIFFDHSCVPNVTFGTTADVSVSPGRIPLEIKLADSTPCGGATVATNEIDVTFNQSSAVVAHLTAQGSITTTQFIDDVRAVAPGFGRLIVRHAAVAGPVNIAISRFGSVLFRNLENGDQGISEVPGETTYSVRVTPGGFRGETVFGPVDVEVSDNQNVIIYAVGSLANDTFTVIADVNSLSD